MICEKLTKIYYSSAKSQNFTDVCMVEGKIKREKKNFVNLWSNISLADTTLLNFGRLPYFKALLISSNVHGYSLTVL